MKVLLRLRWAQESEIFLMLLKSIGASRGYGIVRNYCGHGIGREVHESPEIPNWGRTGHGSRLVSGMTICIEPMINVKGDDVKTLKDGWTVVTKNGSLSAHFEHTIAITPDGPVIMTQP